MGAYPTFKQIHMFESRNVFIWMEINVFAAIGVVRLAPNMPIVEMIAWVVTYKHLRDNNYFHNYFIDIFSPISIS